MKSEAISRIFIQITEDNMDVSQMPCPYRAHGICPSCSQLCIWKYGYQAPVTGLFIVKDLISKAFFSVLLQDPKFLIAYIVK